MKIKCILDVVEGNFFCLLKDLLVFEIKINLEFKRRYFGLFKC